ncbi:MAG: hypothetical protein WB392_03235 [Methanotrichaceae archaeon]
MKAVVPLRLYKPATKLAQISERPNASLNANSNVYPHYRELASAHIRQGINDGTTG